MASVQGNYLRLVFPFYFLSCLLCFISQYPSFSHICSSISHGCFLYPYTHLTYLLFFALSLSKHTLFLSSLSFFPSCCSVSPSKPFLFWFSYPHTYSLQPALLLHLTVNFCQAAQPELQLKMDFFSFKPTRLVMIAVCHTFLVGNVL